MKLGMWHPGLHPIIVYSNDDRRMTLTYFTARSILENRLLQWEKAKTMNILETISA